MRFLVQFSRVIVGLLFILSGMLKLNDPTGFSYKLDEYFSVFTEDVLVKQDTVLTTVKVNDRVSYQTRSLTASDSILAFVVSPGSWHFETQGPDDTTQYVSSVVQIIQNGIPIVFDSVTVEEDQPVSIYIKSLLNGEILIDESLVVSSSSTEAFRIEHDVRTYIKPASKLTNVFRFCSGHTLAISIFISWLEAIVGFALILGWQARFTAWILFFITAFFTFLTWYSWVQNKVTDCGCFGEALPMNPKESFIKNVIIGVLVLLILLRNKRIKPIFSNPFGVKVLTILTMLLVGLGLYSKHYLPVVDFLEFEEGTDIRAAMMVPKGERQQPYIIMRYQYVAKDGSGETREVVYDSDANTFTPKLDNDKWEVKAILEENIIEEGYNPPIQDFVFMDGEQNENHIDSFWQGEHKLLIVCNDLTQTNAKAIEELREIAAHWTNKGHKVWALTSNNSQQVEEFRHKYQVLEFDFHYGDYTQLKSIIRSNPGLLLISDSTVVEKQWPSTHLPSLRKLDKLVP